MKKQIFALMAIFGLAGATFAQTSATIYGYVRGEFAFDTRQVYAARDANYIDLVMPVNKDAAGKDLNATPNFNGWGLESRLGVKISGPEFFGMKSNAVLESHFFGSTGASINGLGLRHAYVQLDNDNIELKVGQFWHPMFVTNVSPGTYNFNAGSPFQPFNRSPQVRLTTKGNVRFIGALLTELDFKSVGGTAATSGLPAFHAQLQFGDDAKFVGGIGANYKSIRPSLGADVVGAYNFLAYAKANLGGATWKGYVNYGQNPTELLQIGGIALVDGKIKSNNTLAAWTEFSGDFSPTVEWGIFGGYSQDMGYDKAPTAGTYFGAPDLPLPVNTWRVSPRVGWKMGNTKFTTELDYTSTTYGDYDTNGKAKAFTNDATAGNLRISLSLIQSF